MRMQYYIIEHQSFPRVIREKKRGNIFQKRFGVVTSKQRLQAPLWPPQHPKNPVVIENTQAHFAVRLTVRLPWQKKFLPLEYI